MRSFLITDIKGFTSGLFMGELFDSFLLAEADFVTDTSLHLDGRIVKDYFDTDEKPIDEFIAWKEKKGLAFQVIKGKRLPVSFKMIFCLSNRNIESTLQRSGTAFKADDVENFYININYKNGKLALTSGLSMRAFTMDKSLPEYWDKVCESFLKKNNISFE